MDLRDEQRHTHILEMLRHMNDEVNSKLNIILEKLGAEEKELLAHQEKWFRELAFQAAKIYGAEHELTQHYKDAYTLQTGKEWNVSTHKTSPGLSVPKATRWDQS